MFVILGEKSLIFPDCRLCLHGGCWGWKRCFIYIYMFYIYIALINLGIKNRIHDTIQFMAYHHNFVKYHLYFILIYTIFPIIHH